MVESKIAVKILDGAEGGFDAVFTLPDGREERYYSVFSDRLAAETFAERVNRLGISELHIRDVLEDALP